MVRERKLVVPLIALTVLLPVAGQAQTTRKVLFVGNSYTEVNNLPQTVSQIAASVGDTLTWQSNTPGGCTFQQHCTNRSMELICGGGWDAVVLQEQSQLPSFPQEQVEVEVFPYARWLVDSIYAHNPCCEPMFYMTWGRKNGDAGNAPYFPVLGTYEGMDSMLCERYTYMATEYDAALCPVGRVWRYLREHYRDIELYQQDDSHPSVAGTYAAACAFYVMLFHRDPDLIGYNATLPGSTAGVIRAVVRTVVFDSLSLWQRPQPQVHLEVEAVDGPTAVFSVTTQYADSLEWHFGDGIEETTSALQTTVEHVYADSGRHDVTLVALRRCLSDTATATLCTEAPFDSMGINEAAFRTEVVVSPNPASHQLFLSVTAPNPVEMTVYDMAGCPVWRGWMTGAGQQSLDVGRWPSGTYTLTADRQTQRIVVSH